MFENDTDKGSSSGGVKRTRNLQDYVGLSAIQEELNVYLLMRDERHVSVFNSSVILEVIAGYVCTTIIRVKKLVKYFCLHNSLYTMKASANTAFSLSPSARACARAFKGKSSDPLYRVIQTYTYKTQ